MSKPTVHPLRWVRLLSEVVDHVDGRVDLDRFAV
jgi:hypothetical protein